MPRGLSLFSNFLVGKNEVGKRLDENKARLRSFEKAGKRASITGGTIFKGALGANIATRGISLLTGGVIGAGREFIDFDRAVTSAGAKFGPMFARGTQGAKELTKVTRGIGAATEFSATQAAEGLDFLALAGFNAKQSIALLPGVVDLATATQSDLARATDIASDSLGAFGLMSKDSAVLGTNLSRVMNVMAKTTTTANTSMEDLFESVKKGAPAFTASGQSVESFSALAGELANSGLKGSEAGTALRNMMLRLADPSAEAGKVIRNLGVKTEDAEGNFRDVVDILADFEEGTKKMGSAQRTAALSTVFGARTVNSVNVLLKSGTTRLREYRKALEDSENAATKLAEAMRKSLGARLAKLRSAAIELGFKFFDAFGPQIEAGIDKITKGVDSMNKNFGALKTNVSGAIQFFNNWSGTIKFAAGALASYWAIQKGIIITQGIMATGLKLKIAAMTLYSGGIKAVSLATKVWAGVQTMLNVALTMNPIGLAIVGIAALTAGVVVAYNSFDTFREKVDSAIDSVKGFFGFGDDNEVNINKNENVLGGGTGIPFRTPETVRAGALGSDTRAESIERKESIVKLLPPDGWSVEPAKDTGTFSFLTLGDNP